MIRNVFGIAITIATFFITGCRDDDDNKLDEGDNFSEYFTCKINGEEFNTSSTFYCNGRSFCYYTAGMGGLDKNYMLISGEDCSDNLSIGLRNFGIIVNTGYLDFIEPSYADSCSPYIRKSPGPDIGIIRFDSLIQGHMNITTFTLRDSITQELGKIEGTFEFTVGNEENDSIIHVTDGAFRFKVPNMW